MSARLRHSLGARQLRGTHEPGTPPLPWAVPGSHWSLANQSVRWLDGRRPALDYVIALAGQPARGW
jgi:hypothetical protein